MPADRRPAPAAELQAPAVAEKVELADAELDDPAGEGDAIEGAAPRRRRMTGNPPASSAEQVLGYPGEPEEILDLSV